MPASPVRTPPRGLIVAAPASGSGKTVVTLALLRRLARDGGRVAGAKAGPDYIDPMFHAAACGAPCPNLDVWAMRAATLAATLSDLAAHADLVGAGAAAARIEPPALIVIGDVVRLRTGLDWLGALSGRVLDADPLGPQAGRDAG